MERCAKVMYDSDLYDTTDYANIIWGAGLMYMDMGEIHKAQNFQKLGNRFEYFDKLETILDTTNLIFCNIISIRLYNTFLPFFLITVRLYTFEKNNRKTQTKILFPRGNGNSERILM